MYKVIIDGKEVFLDFSKSNEVNFPGTFDIFQKNNFGNQLLYTGFPICFLKYVDTEPYLVEPNTLQLLCLFGNLHELKTVK